MKLFDLFKSFHAEEDGAVTVDWVVLTAAVVGLGVAALVAVRGGTVALSDNIGGAMSGVEVEIDWEGTTNAPAPNP